MPVSCEASHKTFIPRVPSSSWQERNMFILKDTETPRRIRTNRLAEFALITSMSSHSLLKHTPALPATPHQTQADTVFSSFCSSCLKASMSHKIGSNKLVCFSFINLSFVLCSLQVFLPQVKENVVFPPLLKQWEDTVKRIPGRRQGGFRMSTLAIRV